MPPPVSKFLEENTYEEKALVDEETVRSFFSLGGASLAIKANHWDLQEEVSSLIRHSRDNDPKISLRAMQQLRGILTEIATTNGLIGEQKVEVTHENENSKVILTGTTSRLVDNLKEIPDVLTNSETPEFAARYFPARSESENSNSHSDSPGDESGNPSSPEPDSIL